MPSNDREVFKYFRDQKNTSREIDHLAYASYAYAKYEWMDHFEKINGRPPTLGDENAWIPAIPQSRFEEFTNLAFDFFDYAARKYLADEIEQERREAVDASIMGVIYAHDPSPIALYKAIVPDGAGIHTTPLPAPATP